MTKRIILILGGKGGTGKTLFCRLLYYSLVQAGVQVLAYDADLENPEFAEFHTESQHPVHRLNFLESSQAIRLFQTIETDRPDVVLIDMPGASGRATREQIQRFGMLDEIAPQLEYRVTIATVLNNGYNTINSLDAMLKFCQAQTDYVAVKSLIWQQGSLTFERWDTSPTRTQFQQMQGVEIEMPILEASTFDRLHEESISFFEYPMLSIGHRLLIGSFLGRSQRQLQLAASYLGLPHLVEAEEAATTDADLLNASETASIAAVATEVTSHG